MKQSRKYELNKADLKSIAITTMIVMFSAVIPTLIDIVANTNFGQYTVVAVPLITALLKGVQKYLAGK